MGRRAEKPADHQVSMTAWMILSSNRSSRLDPLIHQIDRLLKRCDELLDRLDSLFHLRDLVLAMCSPCCPFWPHALFHKKQQIATISNERDIVSYRAQPELSATRVGKAPDPSAPCV
jgi:hypothetical protein